MEASASLGTGENEVNMDSCFLLALDTRIYGNVDNSDDSP